MKGVKTHKLLLPAILGCVAHDPPSTILCFSSKKSAVYPGYSGMASKPSQGRSTVLVHSHTPPISAWPASLLPREVMGTGCQCRKPTFAPFRSVKSASWLAVLLVSASEAGAGGVAGGEISTPLLQRWLLFGLVSGSWRYGGVEAV